MMRAGGWCGSCAGAAGSVVTWRRPQMVLLVGDPLSLHAGSASLINWEEFGRSQRPRTSLNCAQLGCRLASDLALSEFPQVRGVPGLDLQARGHWFEPSSAHTFISVSAQFGGLLVNPDLR
jgi:hypothetical protein